MPKAHCVQRVHIIVTFFLRVHQYSERLWDRSFFWLYNNDSIPAVNPDYPSHVIHLTQLYCLFTALYCLIISNNLTCFGINNFLFHFRLLTSHRKVMPTRLFILCFTLTITSTEVDAANWIQQVQSKFKFWSNWKLANSSVFNVYTYLFKDTC